MAQILDAINIHRSRFTKWAEEWLKIPSEAYQDGFISAMYMQDIIEVLLEKKVFTLDELLLELRRNRIHIPKIIMNKITKGVEK